MYKTNSTTLYTSVVIYTRAVRAAFACTSCTKQVQAALDAAVRPVDASEEEVIDAGLDVPAPMFPGNSARESSVCLINHDLKYASVWLQAAPAAYMHAQARNLC